MDLEQFKTNENLEQEGAWVDITDDAKVLVARIGNPNFQGKWNRKTRHIQRAGRNRVLSEKEQTSLMCDVIAETVFLDFKGITDAGKKISNTVENRRKMLDVKDFREMIVEIATNFENFREEELEEDAKNLRALSGGNAG